MTRPEVPAGSVAAGVLSVEWRGAVSYDEALDLQHELARQRRERRIGDTLIMLEHPAVITFGRRYDPSHLRVPREELLARGVGIHRTERGGEATVHSPGQLVGYVIADLWNHGRDIRGFVSNLEEALLGFLRTRGIEGRRDPVHRGVWVGDAKVASVGIAVRRNITMHGFSLNVSNDLSLFSWIVPCGIPDCRACSIESVTGRREEPAGTAFEVAGHVARSLGLAVGGGEEAVDGGAGPA